jgi:hypothetical protein
MLVNHRVKAMPFLPHTTHIFQNLDLSLFGNFKNRKNDKLPLEGDETAAALIKRVFQMMTQTLIPDDLRNSFIQIGFRYNIETSPYSLPFEGHMLR